VYFGTYEIVKEAAGGNVDNKHHPFAAGSLDIRTPFSSRLETDLLLALSGACATITSDALMNPFDGEQTPSWTH
jgi:solute carrier family 25 (mitochondrial iron transporter), member 28/37